MAAQHGLYFPIDPIAIRHQALQQRTPNAPCVAKLKRASEAVPSYSDGVLNIAFPKLLWTCVLQVPGLDRSDFRGNLS